MVDVIDCGAHTIDDSHGEDRVEIFGTPILFRCRFDVRIQGQRFRIAAQFAAGGAQIGKDRRQHDAGDRAIDQQGFGRAADRDAAHLGVQHDLARLLGVGCAIDIGVAEAFEMGDDRDAALALHPLYQRGAAPRHDDVDDSAHLKHQANRGAVPRGHELYRMYR